jgi:BirA family biotin operon repressor/biotin-[acetyl-CoA-carboxylase] ligase
MAFIRTVFRHESLPSTSDEALRLLVEGRTELPLLVVAGRQTAGRGRGANVWWSDAGSLTFTVGLDPAALGLTVEREPAVALAAAVAVIDAVEQRGPRGVLGIRWPNDVEAGGRKLGGILPERVAVPDGRRLAVGIGLNLTTNLDDAPAPVREMATSLARLAGPVEREALLERICERLACALRALAGSDPGLAERWASLDTLRGQPVRIDLEGRVLSGRAEGIDATGALRVATPGEILTIRGGRVLRSGGIASRPG